MDEWIAIAMEHLPDANGDLSVFRVGRDGGGLWLYADWDALGRTWHPEARFVFVPRKQPLTAGSLSGLENPSDTVTLEFKNKEELVNVLKYRLEAEVTKYRRADWMDDETFILDITAKIVSQLTYSYKKV